MADLYDILGVDKKADKDEIKKNYRAKSKKTHPDTGGDKEEFQLVVIAYKILSDDKKRERYDNGESVDNLEKNRDVSSEMLQAIFMEVVSRVDVDYTDIIGDMRKKINEKDAQVSQVMRNDQLTIKKFKSAIKRLKSKKGNKIFEVLAKTTITSVERNIKMAELDKSNLHKALELLEDFSYDFDSRILAKVDTSDLESFIKGQRGNAFDL